MDAGTSSIYTVSGTVQAGSGIYIEREADGQLLSHCSNSDFAYILSPRQVGKSSLMIRTCESLKSLGMMAVIIDLTQFGTQVSDEACYLGMLMEIVDQLHLDIDVLSWWQSQSYLGAAQRLTEFLAHIVSKEIATRLVIFIDEIDTTLSLPFSDDFFAAIRYLYNARARQPALKRLSFVLIGVATPSDLIRDPQRTPFNIGQRVDLTDFTYQDAFPLSRNLGPPQENAGQTLRWILEWTGGHPYLTQRLCSLIADKGKAKWSKREVDQVVRDTFFGEMSRQDNNLQFVRDMLTERTPDRLAVLTTYREIRRGKRTVADDEQALVKSHLKLSGVVKSVNTKLRVRNAVYRTVFDDAWVREHMPVSETRRLRTATFRGAVAAGLVSLLAFTLLIGVSMQWQAIGELQARQVGHARSVQLATNAAAVLESEPTLALLLSVEAMKSLDTPEARSALLGALQPRYRSIASFWDPGGEIRSVAFSRDGAAIASAGGDDSVRLWRIDSRELAWEARAESRGARTVAYSPDGRTLAAGYRDGTVLLWDAARGSPLLEIGRSGPAAISQVAFSPDGMTLATLQSDGVLRLWEVASGRMRVQAPDLKQVVFRPDLRYDVMGLLQEGFSSMAFIPDGRFLMLGARRGGLFLLEPGSGRLAPSPPWDFPYRGDTPFVVPFVSMSISPDGTWAILGGNDGAILVDPMGRGWAPLTRSSTSRDNVIWAVAANPDGQRQGYGGRGGRIRVEAYFSNSPSAKTLDAGTEDVFSMAFSPDGRILAAGGKDATLRLWDVSIWQSLDRQLTGHSASVGTVAISPDSRVVASGSDDKTVRLWDLRTGRSVATLAGHTDAVRAVAFSPDSRTLAAGGADATVALWDVITRRPLGPAAKLPSAAMSVAFSPDGTSVAIGTSDGAVRRWAFTKDDQWSTALTERSPTVPSPQPAVRATFVPSGVAPTSIEVLGNHRGGTTGVAFGPTGTILASGGADGTVQLWNLSGSPPDGRQLVGHVGSVTSLAFSLDGSTLATSGVDGEVRLWDVATGDPRGRLTSDSGAVRGIALSPGGNTLASTGADGSVRLWDVRTLLPIGPALPGHSGGGLAVAFSNDLSVLVSGGADRTVRLWDTDPSSWQSRACKTAGRNMTADEWKQHLPNEEYRATCPG